MLHEELVFQKPRLRILDNEERRSEIVDDAKHSLDDVVCFLYLANPSRFGRAVFCAGRTGPYEIEVALWVYRIVPLPYICSYVRFHIAVQ